VECTRFGKEKIGQAEAEHVLEQYVKSRCGAYTITETEMGVIPMCSAGIENKSIGKNWIHTGARAGNVKPSTGYSFLKSCKDAEQWANDEMPVKAPGRFAFYDRLLLHILNTSPAMGKPIFERLFNKIPAKNVLDFLREDVQAGYEAKILGCLPKGIFIKAALRDFASKLVNPLFLPLVMAVLLLLLNSAGLQTLGSVILLVGLLLLGIPHGAVDHLLESGKLNSPVRAAFVVKYLSLTAAMACIWWLSAELGLLVFLAYSAWHFGETEMKSTGSNNRWLFMLWGICLLAVLLLFHTFELQQIFAEMGLRNVLLPHESVKFMALLLLLFMSFTRGFGYLLASLYLILTIELPLMQAFGLFFIFDHSIKSSKQLLLGFNSNWRKLYPKAIPFTLGAMLLGIVFYLFNVWQTGGLFGLFFIFLSCLSFPHILAMSGFYRRQNAQISG